MNDTIQQDLDFAKLQNIWNKVSDEVFELMRVSDVATRLCMYRCMIEDYSNCFGTSLRGMRTLIYQASSHSALGGGEPISGFVAHLNSMTDVIEEKESDS